MKGLNSILFCLGIFLGSAQSLVHHKTIDLPKNADNIEVDQFGNIYAVLGTEIRKLDPKGKFLSSFADPSYGAIDQVDVLNALNPMIYYADFNQLRILDNRLNESQSLSMLNLGFNDPKLVAYSDQNRFWVYDQSADRLFQYSLTEQRIVNASPIISQLPLDKPQVNALISGFNYSIIYIEHQGFISFDALGAKREIIYDKDTIHSFDFDNRRWISLNNKGLLKLYPIDNSKRVQKFICPLDGVKKIILKDLSLYFWLEDKLYLYRFD